MQSNTTLSLTANTNQIQSNDFGTYFVNNLLPHIKSFSYTWFHLQAAKRKHFKNTDGRMSIDEELKVKEALTNEESSIKIKWAMRLLMKLRKDIQKTCQKTFIDVITNQNNLILDKCVLSNPDMKGKMRRIDCLRQSDKVWRLDLVMVVLFKGIPLESSDGERLDKCASCTNPQLCINPNHSLLHVRDLEIYLSNFIPMNHLQQLHSNESIVKMSQVNLSSVFTRHDFLELDKHCMRLEKNNENQIEFKEEDDNDEFHAESGGDDCIDKQVNKAKKQKAVNSIENSKKSKKPRTQGSPAKIPIKMVHDENNVDFELNLETDNVNSQLKRKRTIKKKPDEMIVKNEQTDETIRQIIDESTSCSSSQQDDEIKELLKLNSNINTEINKNIEINNKSKQLKRLNQNGTLIVPSTTISTPSSNSIDTQNKRNLASKMIADELKELIQKEKRTTADLFFQLLKVQEDQQQQNQSQQQQQSHHPQQQFLDCYDQNILNNSHNHSQTPIFVDHLLMSPIFGQLLPQSNNNNSQKQDDQDNQINSRNDPSPTKLPTFFPNLINNNTLNMHRPIPISQKGSTKNTNESIQQSIRNSLHNSPLMFNHFHQNISNHNTVFSYPNISPNIANNNNNTNMSNGTFSPTNNLFPSITSLFQSPLCTPRATPTHAFASYFLNNSDCNDTNNAFHSFLVPTSTLQTQLSNSESNDAKVFNTFLDTVNILNDQQASSTLAINPTNNSTLTSQQLMQHQSNGHNNNEIPSNSTNKTNTTSPNNNNRENNLVTANN